ncbi:MAG: hypothetical protein CVV16_03695 [Gammaproteobacteria bacterium HGW-Gammaproteobacteria-6]|nr:MAG: hypothetical protein CVV16_03695 [Gammaproteobacteria bacterium HGW-Gammaproteobacteria-6]
MKINVIIMLPATDDIISTYGECWPINLGKRFQCPVVGATQSAAWHGDAIKLCKAGYEALLGSQRAWSLWVLQAVIMLLLRPPTRRFCSEEVKWLVSLS